MTRLPLRILAWTIVVSAAAGTCAPVFAQMAGHLTGSVKDQAGSAIRGASIHAVNPSAMPNEFTVASDGKGNWGMLGLRAGVWELTASAPGFESSTVAVRVAVLRDNPRVEFVLVGTPPRGALEGIDTKALQADLSAAEGLMVGEQWDAAIAAYRAILAKAPPLTTVNLEIGRALRMKKDFAGAAAAYNAILAADGRNQKALLELGRCQQEGGDTAAAIVTLERLLAIDTTSPEAQEARALVEQWKK